jgi:Tol biopolymer transport system component
MRHHFAAALVTGAFFAACSAPDSQTVDPVETLAQGVRCGANGAGDTCHPLCPCSSGGGDCDANNECSPGLVCGTDNGSKFGFASTLDVCVAPHCVNGALDSAEGETEIDCGGPCGACPIVPTCAPNGQGDTCSASCLCASGWGDCESSAECQSGLACVDDLGARFGFNPSFDVCVPAHCGNGVHDPDQGETGVDVGGGCGACSTNGFEDTCTLSCRCGSGFGDCDADSDCQSGLVCPTTPNGARFGLNASFQACVPAHCTNGVLDAADGELKPDCGGACGICDLICASIDSSGNPAGGFAPVPSGDGSSIVFTRSSFPENAFVFDGVSTERVNLASDGTLGNGSSRQPAISDDGQRVVFTSRSTNLAPNTSGNNVFVRDRAAGTTTLVSLNATSTGGLNASEQGAISGDGRVVAFVTFLGSTRLRVRNLETGASSQISLDAVEPSLSFDGRYVAFKVNTGQRILIRDQLASITLQANVGLGGAPPNGSSGSPSISADGRYVVYFSTATNLVSNDTNGFTDLFRYDRVTNTTERVNVGPSGVQANASINTTNLRHKTISGDGRYVVFASNATNLTVPPTTGGPFVFMRDMVAGSTHLVRPEPSSVSPTISTDGAEIAFQSSVRLIPADTNFVTDVYVTPRP